MRGLATTPAAPAPLPPEPPPSGPGPGLGCAVQRPPGPLPRTGSVRPRPGPPAGSRRGLSRSRWRWKLVGINPGLEGPGLGVGEDLTPRSPPGYRGSMCAYVLGLRPSKGPSVHLPGPALSVRVAKGEATSETKVSEKERRFPAPAGAVSLSLPSRASGSAPAARREPGRTTLGLAEVLEPGTPSWNSAPPHLRARSRSSGPHPARLS
ncbi:PREDICTED: basic proline-rich protein-like [Rhinopithecus bieti]|uniref:basic proline-rich protein-like n=1 Tax=Rhinopithecus bieti TaxID=61621 RepID=UPI00083C290B|nr:PREDICTED: basic proline-rich protein-like [Rhinopithecus bieti]